MVARLERENRLPNAAALGRIARILNLSLDEIVAPLPAADAS